MQICSHGDFFVVLKSALGFRATIAPVVAFAERGCFNLWGENAHASCWNKTPIAWCWNPPLTTSLGGHNFPGRG